MNKSELISAMSEKTGSTKKNMELALNAFIETVEETLANRDSVQLVGFGTFETRERAARDGKNPRTEEIIKIPAKTVPAFKAGKKLKEKVSK